MKVINVTNQKGGVGKGTTGLNLALGLAKNKKHVLYIDSDDQGDSTAILLKQGNVLAKKDAELIQEKIKGSNFFEALDEYTTDDSIVLDLGDVLENPNIINQAILKSKYDHIDIIPATLKMAGITQRLLYDSTLSPTIRLSKALNFLETVYDYVIIDNKPAQDFVVTNNLMVSNLVIIPLKVDRAAIKGMLATIKNMLAIQANNEVNFDFKILFTMVNRNNDDKFIIDLFKEHVVDHMFETKIRMQPKPLSTASLNSEILIERTSKVADDYLEFVKELEAMYECSIH